MSTQFTNRQWRLPNNENKDKQSNYSMDFDSASSDYIDAGSLSLNSNTGTVSAWIKTSYTSDFQIITSIDNQLQCRVLTTGEIRLILYHSGSFTTLNSTSTVNDGNWHNVTFTYSSSGMKIYIDGSLNVSNTVDVTPLTTATDNFLIGARRISGTLSKYFDGQIDAVSIYDYALSSSQITTLYGSSSNGIGNPMALSPKPVAYYPLGDQDAFNGANYLVPNSSLKDYVFDFDGYDDYVTAGTTSYLNNVTEMSLSIWFNLDTAAINKGLISDYTYPTTGHFALFTKGVLGNNYSLRLAMKDGGAAYERNISNRPFTAGQWHNLVMTYANSTINFYIDGKSAASSSQQTTPSSFANSTATLDIGKYSSLEWDGLISNAQIWDTALSSTEVQTLYNYGSPIRTLANIPQNSNLQGWWKLDDSATFDSSTNTWTIPDDSTNSNTGTSFNMSQANLVQSDLSFTSNYSPYALDFDAASSDYIDCGNSLNLSNSTTPYSISLWLKTTSTGTYMLVAKQKNSTPFNGYNFYLSSNQIYFHLGTLNLNSYIQGYTNALSEISNGNWHHLVLTYNGNQDISGFNIYLNNSNISINTLLNNTPSGVSNSESFLISARGSSSNNGVYFNGSLSNVSYWNTALTSSQVSEIYNEGVPSNLNNHSAYSNLVSWWQLGSNSSFNTNWTVLDEKGSNNGTSYNMGEDAIVDGVGSYANGVSSGMSDAIVGDAFGSSANSLSYNMDVLDRTEDTPS